MQRKSNKSAEHCRLCLKSSSPLYDLFAGENASRSRISLISKINSFLPIDIVRLDDQWSSKICAECTKRATNAYDFIQEVISNQNGIDNKLNYGDVKNKLVNSQSSVYCGDTVLVNSTSNTITDVNKKLAKIHQSNVFDTISKLKKLGSGLNISKINSRAYSMPDPFENTTTNIFDDPIKNSNWHDTNNESAEKKSDSTDDENVDDPFGEDFNEDDDDSDFEINKKGENKSTASKANNNRSEFNIIKMKAPPIYLCMTCKGTFKSFDELRKHMKESVCSEEQLTCEFCGKKFEKKRNLRQHMKNHDEPSYICDKCGKKYSNRYSLDNHKSLQHGEYVEEHGNIYKCQICIATFTNRTDLYAHVKNHAEVSQNLLCDTCGKCFNSKHALNNHVRNHLNIKSFACSDCPKRFRNRLLLTQHSHIHTGIKVFQCTACPKAFAKRESLRNHRKKHHPDAT